MQKIIGDFDLELAEIYGNLIDRYEEREINLQGSSNGEPVVIFNVNHAIKYPFTSDPEKLTKRLNGLINDFKIGRGLRDIGMNVPRIDFVGINDSDIPFSIMERLDMISLERLNAMQRKQAIEQYKTQIELARSNGYVPGDVGDSVEPYNCKFDVKQVKLFFYDFTDWRKD